MEEIVREYQRLLASQSFAPEELDYSLLEAHKQQLATLAMVSNSGISLYDMCAREHVFTSYNFKALFGYEVEQEASLDTDYFNSRIHPDDMPVLMRNGVAVLRYFLGTAHEELARTKMISEYRIRGAEDYLRVIEQYRVLEFDPRGNIWLSLSVLDVSPNQATMSGVQSKLMNCLTGDVYQLPEFEVPIGRVSPLSQREKNILRLVSEGWLSKEISQQLAISVHTVNTHRQRILEKLNVDNSLEAVRYASRYGLLD